MTQYNLEASKVFNNMEFYIATNNSETVLRIKTTEENKMLLKFLGDKSPYKETLDLETNGVKLTFSGIAEYKNFCKGINFINNQLKGDDE